MIISIKFDFTNFTIHQIIPFLMGASESVHADQLYGSYPQFSPNKDKSPQLTASKLQQKADNEREQRYQVLKRSLDKNTRPKMPKKFTLFVVYLNKPPTQSRPKVDHERLIQ